MCMYIHVCTCSHTHTTLSQVSTPLSVDLHAALTLWSCSFDNQQRNNFQVIDYEKVLLVLLLAGAPVLFKQCK
jgi:hypothetical protein